MKVTKNYTIEELNKMSVPAAKKNAIRLGISRTPHPPQSEFTHPICRTTDCTNPRTVNDWHWTSGLPVYKDICLKCHNAAVAGKHGLKTISQVVVKNAGFDKQSELLDHRAQKKGFDSYIDMLEQQAREEGFTSLTDKRNSTHPFRKWRKDYCENIDNRLEGGACTTTIPLMNGIPFVGMLDTDHIDGNSDNNDRSNCQTLCKCCHAYKTIKFKDYESPGRTAIKREKQRLKLLAEQKSDISYSTS